jgi:hypothetical protein
MIRPGKTGPHHSHQQAHEAFSLAQRKAQQRAKHQGCLDRQIGEAAPAARRCRQAARQSTIASSDN